MCSHPGVWATILLVGAARIMTAREMMPNLDVNRTIRPYLRSPSDVVALGTHRTL
jgi:hypothetical protein